jgi:hypothetical protein
MALLTFSIYDRVKIVILRIVKMRITRIKTTTARLSHSTRRWVAKSKSTHHKTVNRVNGRVIAKRTEGFFFGGVAAGVASASAGTTALLAPRLSSGEAESDWAVRCFLSNRALSVGSADPD